MTTLYSIALIVVSMLGLCLYCAVCTCKGPWTPTDEHYRKGWE